MPILVLDQHPLKQSNMESSQMVASEGFAPVYPHDPIEEIADDFYMARGSIRINPIVRITRNM